MFSLAAFLLGGHVVFVAPVPSPDEASDSGYETDTIAGRRTTRVAVEVVLRMRSA